MTSSTKLEVSNVLHCHQSQLTRPATSERSFHGDCHIGAYNHMIRYIYVRSKGDNMASLV